MVEQNGLPRLGTRLSISCSLCIVKYIGPVDGTSGTWLGVEWDDPARGKHSGSHDGKAYFTTRYLPHHQCKRGGEANQGELRVPGVLFAPGKGRMGNAGFLRR